MQGISLRGWGVCALIGFISIPLSAILKPFKESHLFWVCTRKRQTKDLRYADLEGPSVEDESTVLKGRSFEDRPRHERLARA